MKYKAYLIPEDELLMKQLLIARPQANPNALKMSSDAELAQYTHAYLQELADDGVLYAGYKIIGRDRRIFCIFYKADE